MPTKSSYEKFATAVFDAEDAVAKAQIAYGKGGSLDAVNKANRALADAHCRYAEVQGQRVPDDRY